MELDELADFLKNLDELDTLQPRQIGSQEIYTEIAEGLLRELEGAEAAGVDPVRAGYLYLDRLGALAGQLADHPKYFEYIVREVLGITPNPHPDEIGRD